MSKTGRVETEREGESRYVIYMYGYVKVGSHLEEVKLACNYMGRAPQAY
jgi:hypothetical protein